MRFFWLFPLLLVGCTVGPDFVKPSPSSNNHYNFGGDPAKTTSAGRQFQRFVQGASPVESWWKLFNSKELDAVVAEGLANNATVQAAQASLRQSEDNLRAGYGIFYPQINVALDPARQKFSPARFGSNAPGSIFNLVTLSASVSYALDMFGGERRAIENLQSQVDLQRYILQGTYLSLSANIVNAAMARAAYREEANLVEKQISLQKGQVAIAEKQVKAGITPYQILLTLRAQLSTLKASLPPLRQKQAQSEHLLATLAGHDPAAWKPPALSFSSLELPRELPLSLPSNLVHKRPDILAAEAELHGASANIGVATAALFPSFTLTGTYGQNNSTMRGLFGSNANFWSLGTNIAAPVFDGGTLTSERQAAIDAYQQSLANYRQTVLSAFAQVADAVRALEHDALAAKAEFQSFEDAKEALHLVRINYDAGTVNYLQVLSSDIQFQQASISLVEARAQWLQDTTALFAALGGGCPDLPNPCY